MVLTFNVMPIKKFRERHQVIGVFVQCL